MLLCDHNAIIWQQELIHTISISVRKASIVSKIRVRQVANFERGRKAEECGTLISASEVTAQGCAVVLSFISVM